MKNVSFFISLLFAGFTGASFCGVVGNAQTVQLPSFQHFDASTTVWVPDGGTTNTAGITRSSSGYKSSGTPILPFSNRSYGSDMSTSNIQTSVQIIDLQEMDEAILNSAAPARVRRPGENLRPEDFYARRQEQEMTENAALMDIRDTVRARIQPKAPKRSASLKKKEAMSAAEVPSVLNSDLVLTPEKSARNSNNEALALAKKAYRFERAGDTAQALAYYRDAAALADGSLLKKIEKRRSALMEENRKAGISQKL